MSRTAHSRPRKRGVPKDGPPAPVLSDEAIALARADIERYQNTPATRKALDLALDSARVHGEQSEPDHEAGDLAELVEALFAEMTEDQRKRALAKYGEGRSYWS